jgi:hypothetical protein
MQKNFISLAQRAALRSLPGACRQTSPFVKELQATGITSLNCIAAALNARRIWTPVGRRHWHLTQVRRVLARLAE